MNPGIIEYLRYVLLLGFGTCSLLMLSASASTWNRDSQIHTIFFIIQLTDEKLNQDKQINNLMAQDKQEGGLQEKDILVSPLFVEISNKLTNTEKEVKGLQNELQSVRDRWASSKGDLELAQKAIEDLEKKHNARLRELSGGEGIDNATGETINGDKTHIEQAKLVMELEHKLKHALDTVRQSESVRMSLADAHSMNDILQRQIGELKAKNEEFASAEKEESNDLLEVSTGTTKDGAQSKDKLYRMKKELTAALESKNEFKYKCEVRYTYLKCNSSFACIHNH